MFNETHIQSTVFNPSFLQTLAQFFFELDDNSKPVSLCHSSVFIKLNGLGDETFPIISEL